MPFVIEERMIPAGPDIVHGFLQDIQRYPEWIPFTKAVLSVDAVEGVVGTVYKEKGTGGTSTWTITEFVQGEREVHEGDIGIATVRLEMTMSPHQSGTRYQHQATYRMKIPVLGWLLDKVVFGRMFRKGMKETVDNMARTLIREAQQEEMAEART